MRRVDRALKPVPGVEIAVVNLATERALVGTYLEAALLRGVCLEPLIHGASHEAGRRAGTESALLAAALGAACELAADLGPMDEVRRLRDLFWDLLQTRFGEHVVLNGHPLHRLPNTLSVSFVGRVGADILVALDDVAASAGQPFSAIAGW